MAITAQSEWLRAGVKSRAIGVDREKKVIRGMVLAQEGPFKTDGRGEFDHKSLKKIVTLARKVPAGLKSRFTHPGLSGDGLGSFLGRVKNVSMDTVTVRRHNEIAPLMAVRGDLHFAESAFATPNGDLASYVMDLAEEDPDAISSSLVLQSDEEQQLDAKGRPALDADGNELPPLWRPTALHASDIVDTGEAVNGLLSAGINLDGLSDSLVREGCRLLNSFLPGESRDVVAARLGGFVERYLSLRFEGDEQTTEPIPYDATEENRAFFLARARRRKMFLTGRG